MTTLHYTHLSSPHMPSSFVQLQMEHFSMNMPLWITIQMHLSAFVFIIPLLNQPIFPRARFDSFVLASWKHAKTKEDNQQLFKELLPLLWGHYLRQTISLCQINLWGISVLHHHRTHCSLCLVPQPFVDGSFMWKATFNAPSKAMSIQKSQAAFEMWLSAMPPESLDIIAWKIIEDKGGIPC